MTYYLAPHLYCSNRVCRIEPIPPAAIKHGVDAVSNCDKLPDDLGKTHARKTSRDEQPEPFGMHGEPRSDHIYAPPDSTGTHVDEPQHYNHTIQQANPSHDCAALNCTPRQCDIKRDAMVREGRLEVLPNGAMHSREEGAFDQIDPHVEYLLARLLDVGGINYGDGNWKGIPIQAHVNHALKHINSRRRGEVFEGHTGTESGGSDLKRNLLHAMCRIMFALSLELEADRQVTRSFELARQLVGGERGKVGDRPYHGSVPLSDTRPTS